MTKKLKQLATLISIGAVSGIIIVSGVARFKSTKVALSNAQIDSIIRVPQYSFGVGADSKKKEVFGASCRMSNDTLKAEIPVDTVDGDTVRPGIFFDMHCSVSGKKATVARSKEYTNRMNIDFNEIDSSVSSFTCAVKTDADTAFIYKDRPFYQKIEKGDTLWAHVRFDIPFASYNITSIRLNGFTSTRTRTYGMD